MGLISTLSWNENAIRPTWLRARSSRLSSSVSSRITTGSLCVMGSVVRIIGSKLANTSPLECQRMPEKMSGFPAFCHAAWGRLPHRSSGLFRQYRSCSCSNLRSTGGRVRPASTHSIDEDAIRAVTIPSTSEQQWMFETPSIGGIIVGFDGSTASRGALETAATIAAGRNWPVHVVSVLPPMSSYRLSLRAGASSDTDELRTQLRESAVRDAIGSLPGRKCWTYEVCIGKAAEEISKA